MVEKPFEDATEIFLVAREAYEAGKLEAAEEMLRRSLQQRPHFKTFELLGEIALRRGVLVEAITLLAAAAGLGNKQSKARVTLAAALEAAGQYHDAATKLREALEINPNYGAAREALDRLVARFPPVLDEKG